MKKQSGALKKCLMTGIAFMLLFSQSGVAQQDETLIQLEKQLEKLKQQLKLSEEQSAAVGQILQEAQLQKDTDRKNRKGDALALIQAGWNRKKNVDNKIEPLLTPGQLEEYRSSGKMDPVDRELFELTEGLGLNAEQAFDVEGILIQLHNEYGQFGDMMEQMGEGGMPPGPPKGGGGFGPGGGKGGMPMGRGGKPGNIMKAREAKKDKAIKKILTEEQKVLYQQIKEDRQKKMKQMREEMKKRMNR